MAGEAQQIKTSVYIPGKGGGVLRRQLTFEMISEWIRLQGFDEYTTEGLIKLAANYPTQALPTFRKNFNLMIQRVRQQRKQETELNNDRPAGELPLGEEPAIEVTETTGNEDQNENQSGIGRDGGEQTIEDEVASIGDGDGLVEHA